MKGTTKFCSIQITDLRYSYFTVRLKTICLYPPSNGRGTIVCIGVTTNIYGNNQTTNKLE